jgi:hypothetical protein
VGTHHNSHVYSNMEDLTPAQVTQQVTSEVEEALVDFGFLSYMDCLMLLYWPASANVDWIGEIA